MTAPMMPSAPSVRPAAPSGSDGRDNRDSPSAEPFATALDGAMAGGPSATRTPPREAGRARGRGHDAADHPGRHLARGHEDTPAPDGPRSHGAHRGREVPGPADPGADRTDAAGSADAPPAAGVPAGLWALLLAAATVGAPRSAVPPPTADDGSADAGTAAAAPVSALDTAAVPALPDPADLPAIGALPGPATPAPIPADPGAAVPTTAAAPPVQTAGPQDAGPAIQPLLAGTQGAPADPAASFAALAATAGATVTAVTSTTQPAAAVAPRPTTAPSPGSDAPDSGAPAVPVADAISVPVSTAGGQSSGTANSGQDGGTSDPSQDGVPELAGLTAGSPAAPVAAPAATAPTAPANPVPAPPVGNQIAQHIAVLRGADDGEHSMTLVLTPERLGPVEIQVTVSKGSLDLSLRGAHEQGRAALLAALPDLRRDLESAGLSCSRLAVDRTTGGAFTAVAAPPSSSSAGLGQSASQMSQHQTPGQRGGQQDWSGGRFRPGLRTADSGESHPAPRSTRSTSPGVDVRV